MDNDRCESRRRPSIAAGVIPSTLMGRPARSGDIDAGLSRIDANQKCFAAHRYVAARGGG